MAKREGCPAIRHSRVDLRGFLTWWFDTYGTRRDATVVLDLTQERAAKERAHRLLLEKRLELANEEWVRWPDVERWIGLRLVQPITQWLQSAPGAWAGHVNPEAPAVGKQALEAMVSALRRVIEAGLQAPPTKGQENADDDIEPGEEAADSAEPDSQGVA